MGDPETQVVLPLLLNDLGVLFSAVANKTLKEEKIEIAKKSAVTVVAVSGGYPADYEKGKVIEGLNTDSKENIIFQAGTRLEQEKVQTNGGRVLAVTSFGRNHREAAKASYTQLNKISFEGMYFRKDIGNDPVSNTHLTLPTIYSV